MSRATLSLPQRMPDMTDPHDYARQQRQQSYPQLQENQPKVSKPSRLRRAKAERPDDPFKPPAATPWSAALHLNVTARIREKHGAYHVGDLYQSEFKLGPAVFLFLKEPPPLDVPIKCHGAMRVRNGPDMQPIFLIRVDMFRVKEPKAPKEPKPEGQRMEVDDGSQMYWDRR